MPSKPPEIDINVSFNLENSPALAYLKTRPYAFANEATDSLLQALRDVWNKYLVEGIKLGQSIYELVEELEKIFRGTERAEWWRARRIARTESIGAANMGTLSSYQQANVPYKTWVTMRDGLVRDSHRPMDGVSIPVNDKFVLPSGAQMDAPGDPAGGIREIVNCRCTILADYAPPSSANGRLSVPKK